MCDSDAFDEVVKIGPAPPHQKRAQRCALHSSSARQNLRITPHRGPTRAVVAMPDRPIGRRLSPNPMAANPQMRKSTSSNTTPPPPVYHGQAARKSATLSAVIGSGALLAKSSQVSVHPSDQRRGSRRRPALAANRGTSTAPHWPRRPPRCETCLLLRCRPSSHKKRSQTDPSARCEQNHNTGHVRRLHIWQSIEFPFTRSMSPTANMAYRARCHVVPYLKRLVTASPMGLHRLGL